MQNNVLMPGDSAGNYDKKWTEAFAPHSMDTPIMMLIGFSLLFGICAIF